MRGLKQQVAAPAKPLKEVAPHVGAWIETVIGPLYDPSLIVAPHVGAWIETEVFDETIIKDLSHLM